METQEVTPHRAFITLAPRGRSRELSLTAASCLAHSVLQHQHQTDCKGFSRPLVAPELTNKLQRAERQHKTTLFTSAVGERLDRT